jgi:hypothetical protein
MIDEQVEVAVDGERLVRRVSLEQVREYLRKRWEPRRSSYEGFEVWGLVDKSAWPDRDPVVHLRVHVTRPGSIERAVECIATHELRHPAAVLREIAGGAELLTVGDAIDALVDAKVAEREDARAKRDAEWLRQRRVDVEVARAHLLAVLFEIGADRDGATREREATIGELAPGGGAHTASNFLLELSRALGFDVAQDERTILGRAFNNTEAAHEEGLGVDAPRCPRCGTVAPSDRDDHKTDRCELICSTDRKPIFSREPDSESSS